MRTLLLPICFYSFFGQQAFAQVDTNLERRIEAIRETAVRTWKLQRNEGNGKAIAETNECRARLLKTKVIYDAEVEACLVVDYYVTLSTASFYSQLSDEYRKTKGIDVAAMRLDVGKRISSAYTFFKLTQADVDEAAKLLREHVFQAVNAVAISK